MQACPPALARPSSSCRRWSEGSFVEIRTGPLSFLAALGATDQDAGIARPHPVSLPKGYRVFESGRPCESYILVQSGQVRVHQLDVDGREVVLYRLGAGDTCILNVAALLGDQPYAAYAVTESPVEALTISAAEFVRLVDCSAPFRAYVFRAHADRIADLMRVIQDVAFVRIDVRLVRRILELAGDSPELSTTHADLAVELGTAREVVSRQLKIFETKGWLRLRKGAISILRPEALEALAARRE